MDYRTLVRPVLAIISIVALIYFFTLQTIGYTIPEAVKGFWGPIGWYFLERTITKAREGKVDLKKLTSY